MISLRIHITHVRTHARTHARMHARTHLKSYRVFTKFVNEISPQSTESDTSARAGTRNATGARDGTTQPLRRDKTHPDA
ncbi:hypothetical protein EVAR_91568_1 [Eumeta japonica]|uniref:Uncharacterized protein n=1 Tax=Eumeta variegata TaxID=151549 RepID=A0A4C1X939_EUMVA|nr:hypothetical protein EVAR_91568_1 [Eumeta japonica]